MEATAAEFRERLGGLAATLPGADVVPSPNGQHVTYAVGRKNFAYFLVNHHGDGLIAINCRAAPGVAATLVASDPSRYFIPAYMGRWGWIGLDLESPGTEWEEVERLLRGAHELTRARRG